jgi:hypothetical protein
MAIYVYFLFPNYLLSDCSFLFSRLDYSGTNFCYPKDESTTLRELLTALAGPSARVPIVAKSHKLDISGKKKRKLVRFVTRSDIMQFACANLDFFGPRLEHTLQGLFCTESILFASFV